MKAMLEMRKLDSPRCARAADGVPPRPEIMAA